MLFVPVVKHAFLSVDGTPCAMKVARTVGSNEIPQK